MIIRQMRARVAAGATALALVACLGGQQMLTTTAEAAPAGPAPAAPPVFARCAICHNVAKGAPNKLGPNLFGTYGHKMGQGSFAFSDAVKKSNLTLDDATLDKWLENPRTLVPGNRMSFPGLKDPAQRKQIIDYLKKQR